VTEKGKQALLRMQVFGSGIGDDIDDDCIDDGDVSLRSHS
jgi:hypothetical protein